MVLEEKRRESRRDTLTEDTKPRRSRSTRGSTVKGLRRSPSGSRSLEAMVKSMKSTTKQSRVHKTIICSPDDVDKKEVISELLELSKDDTLNDVMIENLLLSVKKGTNDKLIEKAREAIINASERHWYRILMKDSFVFTREVFGQWMKQKSTMMLDFDRCGANKEDSALFGTIQWQIHVTMPDKTSADDIYQVLKIAKDDPSVLDVKLSIPKAKAIIPMIDWNSKCPKLKEPLIMVLECGWTKKENLGSYKKLIIACLTLLKNAKRQHADGASGSLIEKSFCSMSSFRNSNTSLGSTKELRVREKSPPPKELDTRAFGRNALWRQREETPLGGTTSPLEGSPSSSPRRKNKKKKHALDFKEEDPAAELAPPSTGTAGKPSKKKGANSSKESGEPLVQQEEQKCLWRTAVDPTTNDTYYFHRKTREVCWDKPQEMVEWETQNVVTVT